jgi:hypothetical protein
MSTVGPPNKNPCMSTSKNKDINNKSKQNDPNYQMQMMLLKPVGLRTLWSNRIKYNQLESSSVSNECVGQAWWNYVCEYMQCHVYFTMFIPASFLL